jgi:hypothetical protein
MIKFSTKNNFLLLLYYPDTPWVASKFEKDNEITLKDTFTFLIQDINSSEVGEDEEKFEFILAKLVGEYFKIEARVLGTSQDFFIHDNIELTTDFFLAIRDQSIFKKIGQIVTEDVYIGGDDPRALPEKEYNRLVKELPNSYEIKRYVQARMGSVLSNYFDEASEAQPKYDRYMNKKISAQGVVLKENFKEVDLYKYESILHKLQGMLENESSYNEKQWQNEILDIILLLYPKYILVFKEVPVRDIYRKKDRQIDFLLVDANGSVDIIEIKRPANNRIITEGVYRDNHIPLRELSGTVMQIEKYIFYLNKWGKAGEDKITKKYKKDIPKDFKIKIINPSAIIIMGRDTLLSKAQKDDFEVVKRKYKNIIDIITYDDLIRRLETLIKVIKTR